MRRLIVLALLVLLCGVTPTFAAFPTVAATNTSTDTVSDTNHTVSLPASIAAGDLLLIAYWGSATAGSWDTACPGFTLMDDHGTGAGVAHLALLYKIASGSEGATVTCTTSVAETSTHAVYRIGAASWHGTSPPEKSACAIGSAGSGGNPDPDSLTVSWGSDDTLWIAVAGVDTDGNISAWPTNYSANNIESVLATAGDIAMGTRELASPNDDPATFTYTSGGTRRWTACTIAVRPVPPPVFPVVAATTITTSDVVSDTSHTVNFPAASSGDLLIFVMHGSATDSTPNTACTGFTLLVDGIVPSSIGHAAVMYRIATGSEGTSVTCTTDLAEITASCAYRITSWHGTTPPESSTALNGTDAAPNPGAVTPSWGSANTLFIALAGSEEAASDFTAYPANYTGSNITGTNATAPGAACAMGTRNLTGTTDDPGAFTMDNIAAWAAVTVAVRFGGSGGGGGGGGGASRPRILGGGVF